MSNDVLLILSEKLNDFDNILILNLCLRLRPRTGRHGDVCTRAQTATSFSDSGGGSVTEQQTF